MPWKCPVCGYENADDASFCIRCGAQKPADVQAQPNVPPPPPNLTVNPTPQQQTPQTPPPPPDLTVNPTPQQQTPQTPDMGSTSPPPPQTINPPASTQQQMMAPPQPPQPVTSPPPPPAPSAPPLPSQPMSVQQKYYILFIQTPYAGLINQKIPLNLDIFPSISLGRSPENVIIVPDPEVSRRHAVISLENGELYIEDLNSTNGTYIYDGKLFQPVKGKQKIEPNSIIKLGNQTIIKIIAE